jgi:ferrous iron transport protein A
MSCAGTGRLVTTKRLSDVKVGDSVTVLEVEGSDEVSIRLMEMGIVQGAVISTLGAAPLGDPLEYALRGYRLSLRRAEAQRVLVQ